MTFQTYIGIETYKKGIWYNNKKQKSNTKPV